MPRLFPGTYEQVDGIFPPYPACCYTGVISKSNANHSLTVETKTETSVSSAGSLFMSKTKVAKLKPRKKPIPLKPLILLPEPKQPTLPAWFFRDGTSLLRKRKYMSIFSERYRKWVLKTDKVRKANYGRVLKYQARKSVYEKRMRLYAMRELQIRNALTYGLPENPYSKVVTKTIPVTGTAKKRHSYNHPATSCRSFVDSPNDTGKFVAYEKWTGVLHALGYNVITGPSYPTPSDFDACTSSALSKARFKVRSNLRDDTVHIGNMIAERAQTIQMVKGFLDVLRAPRHAGKNVLERLHTNPGGLIGDNLLAFKFGVEPLLKDLFGMQEALAKVQELPDTVTVHGRGSQSCEIEVVGPWVRSFKGQNLYTNVFRYVYTCRRTVDVHIKCIYRVDNPFLTGLNGLGLLNPGEILWEVMPWSFVVDWFYPVGQFITASTSDAGLTYLTGSQTVTTKDHWTCRIESSTALIGISHIEIDGTGSKSVVSKQRTVLTTPPEPTTPHFKNPFSGWHLAESLALFHQRFSKK